MNTLIFISVCLIMVSLFAIFLRCAPVVSKPSDITLAQALTQVRDGIQLLQVRPPGSKPAGLLISEVQVTFNITAKASNSDKICLDLSPPPIAKVIPKGSIESKGLSLNKVWPRRRLAGMHGEEASEGRCGAIG